MNDSQERLREMLQRRGDRVHSSLTISDIRDAGLRTHRHPKRLLAPLLVAASVAIVVVVVALGGRQTDPGTPPAGPGPTTNHSVSTSVSVTPTTTAAARTVTSSVVAGPGVVNGLTSTAASATTAPVPGATVPATTVPATTVPGKVATTTVRASG